MKNNNNHPYYNRPSIQTSYQIALICLILWCVFVAGYVLGDLVSEVVSDFDNTSINKKEDNTREISYYKETIDERMLKRIKSRRMNMRIYRYIDIDI